MLLTKIIPSSNESYHLEEKSQLSQSPVAPFRVVNIGNGKSENLMDFIEILEIALGKTAAKNLIKMQAGDVYETYANTDLLEKLTGFRPSTCLSTGIEKMVKWYFDYI